MLWPILGFRCLNQTYSCSAVQFVASEWHYGHGYMFQEFRLHPAAAAAVPPEEHHFYPDRSLAASDPATAGMSAKVQHFNMAGNGDGLIASGKAWTWRTSGLSGPRSLTPRRMYQHACGNTLWVAWARHERMHDTEWTERNGLRRESAIGRITTFRTAADGTLTQVSDREFAECNDMGAITSSTDCGVVAALCRTDQSVTPASVPGARDFVAEHGPGFGWDDTGFGDEDYQTGRQINRMWLYEWNDGVVSTTPDNKTHINSAIGGWNYGHWELSLNNDDTVYMFDLKVSLGGHEGSTNSAIWRTNKSWVPQLSGGWACGAGHILGNRIAYNTALDKWGRVCWVDMDASGGDEFPSQRGPGGEYLYYSTVAGFLGGLSHLNNANESLNWPNPLAGTGMRQNGLGSVTEIDRQRSDGGYSRSAGFGGSNAIVSLGEDGYMVAGIKAGLDAPVSADDANCRACDTAGLLKFPKEGAVHFRQHRSDAEYAWNWFGEKAAEFPEAYPGADRRVGFANAANFGTGGENASEVLVGWAERQQGQINNCQHNNVGCGQTDHFVVSRADRNGKLIGQPWSLQGGSGSLSSEPTGWGEDNNWVTMPATGCVVMVHAWREYSGPRPTMGNGCETRLPSGAPRPECDVHPPSATEDGPGLLPYQPDKAGTLSKYTNRLTLTSVCPVCGYVTPDLSAARKPPTLRSRRGYPCSSNASVGADARQEASPQSPFSQDHPECAIVTSEPTTPPLTTSQPSTSGPTTPPPSTGSPTTPPPTTTAPTTPPPSTTSPTTSPPTTPPPTTPPPTTTPPTTPPPTTRPPTTPPPTTPPPTTPPLTTTAPTTASPTTTAPSTGFPTTPPPTTTPPTTPPPTTTAPSTSTPPPSTISPTTPTDPPTNPPTTLAPTSAAPTDPLTNAPTTPGPTSAAPTNQPTDPGCHWTPYQNRYSNGYAGGVHQVVTLADAQARCLELGASVCRAVTCGYDQNFGTNGCTVRASADLGTSPTGETSYVPSADCTAPTTTPPTTISPTTSAPTTTSPTSDGTCRDSHDYCVRWADLGYCIGEHDVYMTAECPRACYRCPDNFHDTPPVNTRPDPVSTTIAPPTTPPPTTTLPTPPPPTPPPPPACHVQRIGRPDGNRESSRPPQCVADTSAAAVRCCSATDPRTPGFTGWAKRSSACPYAESNNFAAGVTACTTGTFAEAQAVCESASARLCTSAELLIEGEACTRGTGCGFDTRYVWTNTAGMLDGSPLAADMAAIDPGATTPDEPGTSAASDSLLTGSDHPAVGGANLASSLEASDANGDGSNDGFVAGAVIGTLVVVAIIALVLYVRQQGQRTKRLEDGEQQQPPNATATAVAATTATAQTNPPKLDGAGDEIFQPATDGQSIRLESVNRSNPVYRNSLAPGAARLDPLPHVSLPCRV